MNLIRSFTNLFKKPYTANYPKEDIPMVKDYRGLIEYTEEHCIFCDKCEKTCPPRAIIFYQHEDGSKEYRYNPYLCIYCGECVRNCPKIDEALTHTDKKCPPATDLERVNEDWFTWEKKCKDSREEFKRKKAEAKKAKQEGSKAP